jgi:hypothetical protein
MKANEILPILQDWHDRVKELEEKMRAFYGVVGCVPESPFSTAVYGLIGRLRGKAYENGITA